MRKMFFTTLLALLLIAMLYLPALSQGRFLTFTEDTMSLKALNTTATSAVYHNNYENIAFNVWAADTTVNDSVDFFLYIDFASRPGSSDWAVFDTVAVTAESTWTNLTYYYKENHPMLPFYRFRCKADSGNSKSHRMILKVRGSGYYPD